MGIVVGADELIISPNGTPSVSQKSEGNCGLVNAKNAILLPLSNYQTPSEELATPDSNRENGEPGDNVRTPKESVFDPFAPGPRKFMLAPHPRKYMEAVGTKAVQKLTFERAKSLITDINRETSGETISEEDNLFESMYNSILDAIVSEQTKADSDGFRTPSFARHLSGIAETCPGAPVKSTSKHRNIDKELCRKLEF